jgi:hypothetical protein
MFHTGAVNAQIVKNQVSLDPTKRITAIDIDVCLINNGTYLDCPVLANNTDKTFLLTTYNPSQRAVNNLKIKVPPHGHYVVTRWNDTFLGFSPTAAVVICASRLIANGSIVDDCDMHINATFEADAITLVRVVYDATVNIRLSPQAAP